MDKGGIGYLLNYAYYEIIVKNRNCSFAENIRNYNIEK
jgi:hypothetical protein